MKKSILAAFVAAAFCTNATFASAPSQDKPVSKTVTTKTTSPMHHSTTATKTGHKKQVKKS